MQRDACSVMEVVRPAVAASQRAGTAYTEAPVGVVIVDADPAQRRTLSGMISERGNGRFAATVCATRDEAIAALQQGGEAIVIADLDTVGGPDGLGAINGALIATSANGSLTNAVAAMKAGARDFVAKPIGAKALIERLEAALTRPRHADNPSLKQDNAPAASSAQAPISGTDFAGFVGKSAQMLSVYEQIRRMAPSRAPVFITGESGTGKEVCAEAIHTFSGTGERPFIALNCSAIPRDLMESEIFGHTRGAFTGASENRIGAAEMADGGTLFLDEIGEMDLALQAKLLRFVQTGKLRRVGGSEQKQVDVRIICATNRDPELEVADGRFRADLFYRLHVLPIHLPPLRERREDIMLLAEAFLAHYGAEENRHFNGFDPDATQRLRNHAWPGNVRELANTIRRLVVMADGNTVHAAMLPETIRPRDADRTDSTDAGKPGNVLVPFHLQERQIIENAIALCEGNVPRAAAALEISPSTIYRKLQAWNG